MGAQNTTHALPSNQIENTTTSLCPPDVSLHFDNCPMSHVLLLSLLSSVITIALLVLAMLAISLIMPGISEVSLCPTKAPSNRADNNDDDPGA